MSWFLMLLHGINIITLNYFIILNSTYLVMSVIAFFFLRRYTNQLRSFDMEELIRSAGAPPISLLVPAYNEETTCVESIRSLLTLKYSELEIIVVNDGSKDKTLERIKEEFELRTTSRAPTAFLKTKKVRGIYQSFRYPNMWVIDKENGGKADSLNVGINFCRTPLFCAIDADGLLERDALLRVVRPFLENQKTVAVGGIIRIVNDCEVKAGMVKNIRLPKNIWARFQVLEYLRAFLGGRVGWYAIRSTMIISGAFGLFKRSVVVDAGGYYTDTVGEDLELVVRLHHHCRKNRIPYDIAFIPDPIAWTECPETLKVLGVQRSRWQRGLAEALTLHLGMLFNPRYGRIGFFAFPHFFFLEMLGPLVEILGYMSFIVSLIMGALNTLFVIAFFMVAFVLGITLSIVAVALEEIAFPRYPRIRDLLHLFYLAVIEYFGYRQLNQYWRFKGMLSKLFRVKGWGKMERKGFSTKISAP